MPYRALQERGLKNLLARYLTLDRLPQLEAHPRGREGLLLDRDRNDLGGHRGVVRPVKVVAEQKLEGVLPRRQLEYDLGLPTAKVTMLFITRDRECEIGKSRIDQQVVMTGLLLVDASRRDPHACEPELNRHRIRNDRTVHR